MSCLICDNIHQYSILFAAGAVIVAWLIGMTLTVGRRWGELPRRSAGWLAILGPGILLALFGYLDLLTLVWVLILAGMGGVIVWGRRSHDIEQLDQRYRELCEEELGDQENEQHPL